MFTIRASDFFSPVCTMVSADLKTVQDAVNGLVTFCGLVITLLNVIVLCHISLMQSKKGFRYLLLLGCSCSGGLLTYSFIPTYDEDVIAHTYAAFYVRAYVIEWLSNAFWGCNAYLIVFICLDKYVLMHRAEVYNRFTTVKVQASLILFSGVLGVFAASRFQNFYVQNGTDPYTYVLNNYTRTAVYHVHLVASVIVQYYIPAALMVVLSVFNVRKLHSLLR